MPQSVHADESADELKPGCDGLYVHISMAAPHFRYPPDATPYFPRTGNWWHHPNP
ncbi:MAG: hypothetical protein ACLPYO_13745 [Mycobacterium sp.]